MGDNKQSCQRPMWCQRKREKVTDWARARRRKVKLYQAGGSMASSGVATSRRAAYGLPGWQPCISSGEITNERLWIWGVIMGISWHEPLECNLIRICAATQFL